MWSRISVGKERLIGMGVLCGRMGMMVCGEKGRKEWLEKIWWRRREKKVV